MTEMDRLTRVADGAETSRRVAWAKFYESRAEAEDWRGRYVDAIRNHITRAEAIRMCLQEGHVEAAIELAEAATRQAPEMQRCFERLGYEPCEGFPYWGDPTMWAIGALEAVS